MLSRFINRKKKTEKPKAVAKKTPVRTKKPISKTSQSKVLTAEGWRRLMMQKYRKQS